MDVLIYLCFSSVRWEIFGSSEDAKPVAEVTFTWDSVIVAQSIKFWFYISARAPQVIKLAQTLSYQVSIHCAIWLTATVKSDSRPTSFFTLDLNRTESGGFMYGDSDKTNFLVRKRWKDVQNFMSHFNLLIYGVNHLITKKQVPNLKINANLIRQ